MKNISRLLAAKENEVRQASASKKVKRSSLGITFGIVSQPGDIAGTESSGVT
jgi:hypothetical protein